MTKLCQTSVIILLLLLTDLKNTFYTNFIHCFTASITDHLISVLPELKKTLLWAVFHQLRYQQLHFVECRAKCATVPQRRELVTGTPATGQGSK